jgi:uncharacterized protein YbjT (DUF2867 family)
MKQEHIVLVGATGLTGRKVLDLLLAHPGCGYLTILVRKKIALTDAKLKQVVCDYNSFSAEMLPTCDRVFCCLGTTIKVAGSKEVFEAVDRHYPVAVAKAAFERGAKVFSIITAIDSSASSKVFYSKVKGLCEDDLKVIGYDGLLILRPSMLLGARKEKRVVERIGQVVMEAIAFMIPARYKAVSADCVAEVMVRKGMGDVNGVVVIESEGIRC